MKRIAVCLLVGFSFAVAHSHVHVVHYEPAPNAVLTEPPQEVVITFVGSLEPVFSKIAVFREDNKKISKGTEFLADDTTMKVKLPENLPPGTYTVKWVCIGLDGHRQTAEYIFTIS